MIQTINEGIIKDLERAKAYTKEYLDAMPEAGYRLKPTTEVRTFSEQMLHLTDLNYALVAAATFIQVGRIGENDSRSVKL